MQLSLRVQFMYLPAQLKRRYLPATVSIRPPPSPTPLANYTQDRQPYQEYNLVLSSATYLANLACIYRLRLPEIFHFRE